MPIPTKPDQLREMIAAAVTDMLSDVRIENPTFVPALVDTIMAEFMKYDPCFAKATEKGEPTFTLRAQDRLASYCVEDWAERAYHAREKARAAGIIADAMRAWPNRKLPD